MGYITNQGNGTSDFLRVVNGKLCKKVEEGTEGAVRREYTVQSTGEKKHVWELQYPAFEGKLIGCGFVDLEHGTILEVELQDGSDNVKISLPYPGRIAESFICRAKFINLSIPLSFNAGLDKVKGTNFIYLRQNGKNVPSTFTKDDPNGCPPMVKKVVAGKVKWDGEDRTNFLYEFIKSWAQENSLSKSDPSTQSEPEEEEEVPF